MTKHLPTSIYTAKGHLNQERKFLQSTKSQQADYDEKIKHIKNKLAQLKKQVTNDKSLTEVIKQTILDDAFPSSNVPNV